MHRYVFVTGATGFVGSYLAHALNLRGYIVTASVRREVEKITVSRVFKYNALTESQGWEEGLEGQDVVIHCAAVTASAPTETSDSLVAFRKANVAGTLNLARQAAKMGVKRFIFISSIKVNGEATSLGRPYQADDLPKPEDPYGISKHEAEQVLNRLSSESGMEVVIVRPPLVYGPGVKGNFADMIKLVQKGLPLPFGAVRNKRSLVGIDNLVDLIVRCIDHPAAANQVFLAGDGEDLSTTDLLRRVGFAMDKPA